MLNIMSVYDSIFTSPGNRGNAILPGSTGGRQKTGWKKLPILVKPIQQNHYK